MNKTSDDESESVDSVKWWRKELLEVGLRGEILEEVLANLTGEEK